ncbi:exodeoxyribonuclease III (xth) [Nitrincola nitratireducens]|uniref:Exodeoxyribonuclease III (Xth) n=1 Tax=Nitrincola nitratireducens TaxID=1229521 RepID=W9UYJ1_9GAMM|nr:exodeoxyribonuclease III (xth) [Nitrincola nitratireducens]
MRVISFNTQGIEQAAEKGFFDWMVKQDADVVCLQSLRAKEYQLDDERYHPEAIMPISLMRSRMDSVESRSTLDMCPKPS